MVNLSFEDQSQIVEGCFQSLTFEGKLLQFTYGPLSPLPSRKLGLKQKRLGHVLFNFPPATVWQYSRALPYEKPSKRSSMGRLKQKGLRQFRRFKKHSLKSILSKDLRNTDAP